MCLSIDHTVECARLIALGSCVLFVVVLISKLTHAIYVSLTKAPTALGIHRCQTKRRAADKGLRVFWVRSSVLLLKSERRPGESRAEGTAFTLLQEGDARVSDAPEQSDGSRELLPLGVHRVHVYSTPHVRCTRRRRSGASSTLQ